MAELLKGQDISGAWLAAMEHLLQAGGTDVNLGVVIALPTEDIQMRRVLDGYLSAGKYPSIQTVANTLFPQAFYQPERGESAREWLYDCYRTIEPVARRHTSNRQGTYFGRLIRWPKGTEGTNQLEQVIQKLRRELSRSNPKSSIYELGLGIAGTVDIVNEQKAPVFEGVGRGVADDFTADLRVYSPGSDNSDMGFPCLSHISLTLKQGHLHLAALYRNQHFIRRAYGNYLGLSRLLLFICQEAGCEPGEILCIASHADAEIASCGKRSLQSLVKRCHSMVPIAKAQDSTSRMAAV